MPKLIKIHKHRSSLLAISSNTLGAINPGGNDPTTSPTKAIRRASAAAATSKTTKAARSSASSSTQRSHQQPPGGSAGGKRLSLELSTSKQVKRWDERYDELVKFKVLYGSCRVPHRYQGEFLISCFHREQAATTGTLRGSFGGELAVDPPLAFAAPNRTDRSVLFFLVATNAKQTTRA
jgi:hypothetical protein